MKHQYVVTFEITVDTDEVDPDIVQEEIELNVNCSNFNIESTLENIEYLDISDVDIE